MADPLTRGRGGVLSPRVGTRGGEGLRRAGGQGLAPEAVFPESGAGGQLPEKGDPASGARAQFWEGVGGFGGGCPVPERRRSASGESSQILGGGIGAGGGDLREWGQGSGVPTSGAVGSSGPARKRCPRVGPGKMRGCEVALYLPRALGSERGREGGAGGDLSFYTICGSGSFFAT